MKNSTRKLKTYQIDDILYIKGGTTLTKIIGSKCGGNKCLVDEAIYHFKAGRVYWTYKVSMEIFSTDKKIFWRKEFDEYQLDKYFFCTRVMLLKHDEKLNLLI